jgi:hypothetical protein
LPALAVVILCKKTKSENVSDYEKNSIILMRNKIIIFN